jgi:hypothetical protein
MATIDVGTVSGISIGTTPPSNSVIIWYDTTDKLHKSYDASLGQWVPMSQAIVSQISDFNDLINKANLPGGLPIAAFYNVLKRDSDPSWSTMVWVVGQTRIQYVDKQNNIIVEDLAGQGTTTQYVASTNYFFDNVVATFDRKTSQLNFNFQQLTDNPALADVLYGMRVVGDNPMLVKRTVKSLLSTSSKNSLGFVNGLFFDFNAAMSGIIVSEQANDTQVVGYKQYAADYAAMNKTFEQVQEIVTDWQNGSREIIFSAKLTNVEPVAATISDPQDLTTADDLMTALNKIQGWYNRLKLANGMSLSSGYAAAAEESPMPAAGDPVEQAIALLHRAILDIDLKYANSSEITVGGDSKDFPDIPYNTAFDTKGSVYAGLKVIWSVLNNILTGDDEGSALKKLVASGSIYERNVLKKHLANGIVGGATGFTILAGGNNYNLKLGERYFYNIDSAIGSQNWTLKLGMLNSPSALEMYTQESVGGVIEVIIHSNPSATQNLKIVDGTGTRDYQMSKGYYHLVAWASEFVSEETLNFECFISEVTYII